MLRRQNAITDKVIDINIETTANSLTKRPKIASLAPYLAEIQRRKKMKSIRERSKNNLYHDSSKSFRIKEKSALSLQKGLISLTREVCHNSASQRNQLKGQSKQLLPQNSNYSKTIESRSKAARPTDNNFFNDIYLQMKGKKQKGQSKSIRRSKFQTLDEHRTRSQLGGELNMYKISFTNVTKVNCQSKQQQQTEDKKRVDQTSKKNNFRRNKYEALHSSVNTYDAALNDNKIRQGQNQSDGHLILDKKQSNVTINIEMDKLAEKQMSTFYQQVANKQVYRKIQKSTQKYFDCGTYRPVKSKNDIQVYLSSLANPATQKDPKSTNQKSEKPNQIVSSLRQQVQLKSNELLGYDFQFRNEDGDSEVRISQMSDLYQESQVNLKSERTVQRQGANMQIEEFAKNERLLTEKDDCRIDQI